MSAARVSPATDAARPTTTANRSGGVVLLALDAPGGPWLLHDAAGEPCLWLGGDGRVCDVGRRYAGKPADVLADWLAAQAGRSEGHRAIRLRPDQISSQTFALLGRKVGGLVRAGIWPLPESSPSEESPPESSPSEESAPRQPRQPRSALNAEPLPAALTRAGQQFLFGVS